MTVPALKHYEAVYMRESPRHHWKLQAVKFEDGIELARALTAQAREKGYSLQYCIAVSSEYNFPQSFKGDPSKGTVLPRAC